MTKTSGGPTIDRRGVSAPTGEERGREFAGTAGNSEEKGDKPSHGDRDRASAADDRAAIDLDTAHDRAS